MVERFAMLYRGSKRLICVLSVLGLLFYAFAPLSSDIVHNSFRDLRLRPLYPSVSYMSPLETSATGSSVQPVDFRDFSFISLLLDDPLLNVIEIPASGRENRLCTDRLMPVCLAFWSDLSCPLAVLRFITYLPGPNPVLEFNFVHTGLSPPVVCMSC